MKDLIEALNRALKLDEDYDFDDVWAKDVFTDGVDSDLVRRLGDLLHDIKGVPVRCDYSRWNSDGLVAEVFNNSPIELTEKNLESIADRIYSAYNDWKRHINCDAPDPAGNDWYNDTGEADEDGWPNDAMSDDPDYCNRVNNWWDEHRFEYESDEDDEYNDEDDIYEALNRAHELDEGRPSKELTDKIASTTQYIQEFYDNCKTHFEEFGGIQALGIEEMVKYYLNHSEPIMIQFVTSFGDVRKVADVMESYIQSSNYDARITSAENLYHTYKRGPGVRTKPTLTIEFLTS